jgi:hypothetical protein
MSEPDVPVRLHWCDGSSEEVMAQVGPGAIVVPIPRCGVLLNVELDGVHISPNDQALPQPVTTTMQVWIKLEPQKPQT